MVQRWCPLPGSLRWLISQLLPGDDPLIFFSICDSVTSELSSYLTNSWLYDAIWFSRLWFLGCSIPRQSSVAFAFHFCIDLPPLPFNSLVRCQQIPRKRYRRNVDQVYHGRKVIGKYGFNIIQYQCLNLPGALAGLHGPGSCYAVRCHVMRSGPSRPAVWLWHHGYHGRGGSCVSAGRIQCLGLPTQGFLVQLHWGEVFGTDLPAGRQDHSNQIQVQEWNVRSWASWLSAGMAFWHFVDG